MSPGPQTGSPNFHAVSASHEVLLFQQPKSNNTGCVSGYHSLVFEDDVPNVSRHRQTYECCDNSYQGIYQPNGRLAEYIGSSMHGEWTLVVEDMSPDAYTGLVHGWSIMFESYPCVPKMRWTQISPVVDATSQIPIPRYHAMVLSYQKSLFIYGGRDRLDRPLNDLHRYDADTNRWTALSPVNFDFIMRTTAAFGYNLVLSSWGLIKFGGYMRQPFMTTTSYNYVGGENVYVCDLLTLKWSRVPLVADKDLREHLALPSLPLIDQKPMSTPPMRYLSSALFIPASALHWRQSSRPMQDWHLYGGYVESVNANHIGQLADSLLVFGGHSGATGSIFDGSSGGQLSDMWQLRFANWSTGGMREELRRKMHHACAWRQKPQAAFTQLCLQGPNSQCDVRNLLLLAWCAGSNQTIV